MLRSSCEISDCCAIYSLQRNIRSRRLEKTLQNSQENTCVGVSFFDKVADLRPTTSLKKRP